MQWMTLFNKEIVENWRNKKWIWVPIVMIILCTMDPLTYYYLPEIMEMAGNVPEELLFELPEMLPTEVILLSLEQLSMFGVLVIILITMNTIAGEKKNGITEIILVKPIKPINYVTSKWAVYSIISVLSLTIGLLINFYYTNILYGDLSFLVFVKVTLFYSLWFVFVVTLSIFYNTILKSPGIVVASTVATLFVMAGISMGVGHRVTWFPNQLSHHIHTMVQTETIPNELIGTSVIISMLILILLIGSILIFKHKESVS